MIMIQSSVTTWLDFVGFGSRFGLGLCWSAGACLRDYVAIGFVRCVVFVLLRFATTLSSSPNEKSASNTIKTFLSLTYKGLKQ